MGGGDKYPFFSIIIPIYNTEKYIARCLESCIHQTFKDIEIIVVDDCGEDNAIQIAQEYAKKDSRIKIIHNPQNLGLFHTRIVGETKALGEYVLHVDSDDCIQLETCEILYIYCKNFIYDIVAFLHTNITLNGESKNIKHTRQSYTLIEGIKTLNSVWGKVYKKSILQQTNDFIFQFFKEIPKITMAEDALKLFVMTLFSKKYLEIKNRLYIYHCNTDSITADCRNIEKNYQKIKELNFVVNALQDILREKYPHDKNARIFYQHIKKITNKYIYIYYHSKAYENKPFAYPINFLKSLWYVRSPKVFGKTIVRIFIYCITLGRKKI